MEDRAHPQIQGPPAPRGAIRRLAPIMAVVGILALGVGCGKTITATDNRPGSTLQSARAGTSPPLTKPVLPPSTGPGSGSGSPPSSGHCVSGFDPSAPTTLAKDDPCRPIDTPPTTCVPVPASTTALPGQGGGELRCGQVGGTPDGVVSSPPNTDTAFPPVEPRVPKPDATRGVVQVFATGGYDCGGDPCPAIAIMMAGTITLTGDSSARPATTQPISPFGSSNFLVVPGHYDVTAQTTNGTCLPQTVDVVANATTDVSLNCTVPYNK